MFIGCPILKNGTALRKGGFLPPRVFCVPVLEQRFSVLGRATAILMEL